MHTGVVWNSFRSGVGLMEVLIAIAILSLALPAAVQSLTSGERLNQSAALRLVLELRARRHLAEMATTSFHVLVSAPEFPVSLEEPKEPAGYGQLIRNLTEEATVKILEEGLAEAEVRIRYREPGSRGRKREIVVHRLISSPTLALESRFPISGGLQ